MLFPVSEKMGNEFQSNRSKFYHLVMENVCKLETIKLDVN